jgi:Outer membrane protein beta-barrel domain
MEESGCQLITYPWAKVHDRPTLRCPRDTQTKPTNHIIMKKINIAVLTSCGLLTNAFAGQPTYVPSSKTYKAPEPIVCFSEHEWQVDLFGQYSVGEGPHQAGIFRDHGWGGGIGINYFFTRNLGLGVDAAWLYAKESDISLSPRELLRERIRDRFDDSNDNDHTTIHNFSGSLIWRFPLDEHCLAPYIYVGGGCHVDGEQWASAHGGVGVEYRIQPQKYGVFLDGRWTYLGDRFGHGDLNFFSTRLGFRFIF